MARRMTTKDKWKAKSWYTVVSPKEFGEKEVGETPAAEASEVVGRRVDVSASEIATGQRLSQVKLVLEVEKVAGSVAKTRLAGYEVARSYIRSLVRRRRRRIDLIKDYTLDGQKVRVKAITMALGKCYSSQERDIRRIMGEVLDESVKGKDVTALVQSALNREVQDAIKEKARKVFPVAGVEIRRIEFL
jgi:small subunit ribosomal protein S3Ae